MGLRENEMKLVFIVPYFGQFKNYFQLFLNSCKFNEDITWLIFTDVKIKYNFPSNVKVYHMAFNELRSQFQSKFDFPIALDKPYKLCDYRPAYGYLFSEYIDDYDAWGYCDTDLIWGNISEFITDKKLKEYDKIGDLGHCTIFKNTSKINKAFMLDLNNDFLYKKVFSNKNNQSFDEEYRNSINNIFEEHGFKILPTKRMAANIYTKSSDFKLTYLKNKNSYHIENKSKNIFIWSYGSLIRYVNLKNRIEKREYLYIHMQSRNMKLNVKNDELRFKIIPNSFDALEEGNIDVDNFPKYKHLNLHYFKLRSHNLIDKIKKNVF